MVIQTRKYRRKFCWSHHTVLNGSTLEVLEVSNMALDNTTRGTSASGESREG
jgi:hypothetical protein